VPAGCYDIEYTDSTHLQPTEWVRLATLDVRPTVLPLDDNNTEQFYTLTKAIGDLPGRAPTSGASTAHEKSDPNEYSRKVRTIEDTLALALGRIGLLAPDVSKELLEQLLKLDEQEGVVIVPDTNALHNGAVHWLLRVLHRHSVWLMPVVASMTTIQTRDATVKGLVNKFKIGNLGQALRSRGLVNGALGLLERNRGRCQVVEIDPSLLRYQKMASASGTDPDQGDVLEDRLIIEAIHSVLRSMRSRTARRVVTSDVQVARILAAEGIEVLFVPTITLGETAVSCLRYDALAREFVGAPLRATVWELAHAFGSIRLRQNKKELVTLECYWPGKTPAEWASETLRCTFPSTFKVTPASGGKGEKPSDVGTGDRVVEAGRQRTNGNLVVGLEPQEFMPPPRTREHDTKAEAQAARSAGKQVVRRLEVKRFVPITTAIPRASLPQMLRLLGSARRLGSSTAEGIVEGVKGGTISVDKARRPLEILRRMHLLDQDEDRYRPTSDVELIDAALRTSDLDLVSSVMGRFDPYRLFLDVLRSRGRIKRTEVVPLIHDLVGATGTAESERLPRFHILLGQAWTMGDSILDGSQRATDRDATDAFGTAFRDVASVGIARVLDLLPRFCALTRTSPWAAKRQIERFVATRVLPEYSFQPAAGTKPVTRDETITGTLDDAAPEPVVIDRLYLGERPVFTIEGPSQ
jgi:hypothetical protein